MTHELLLLRHAKSDWSVEMDDFSRPLKKRGRRAAKRMGRWLYEQELIPDLILCSPAIRALATAQRVCSQLNIQATSIVCDPAIYEANAQTLLDLLRNVCDQQRVMLVGHNPGLENLLIKLVPHPVPLTITGKCLTTAALARLSFNQDWSELTTGSAELISLVRPDSLPE